MQQALGHFFARAEHAGEGSANFESPIQPKRQAHKAGPVTAGSNTYINEQAYSTLAHNVADHPSLS